MRLRAVPVGGVHVRPGQHELDRPAHGTGGGAGQDGVRPDRSLRAEPAAEVARDHPDVLERYVQRLADDVLGVAQGLCGLVHRHLRPLPHGGGGVGFDRVVVVHGDRVLGLDADVGLRHALGDVAPLEGVGAVRSAGLHERLTHRQLAQRAAGFLVLDLDQLGGPLRLLQRLRDDEGDRLAGVVDLGRLDGDEGLEERPVGGLLQPRHGLVGVDGDDSAGGLGGAGVDPGDAPAGDGAHRHVPVQQPGDTDVRGVLGRTGHLQPGLHAGERPADDVGVHREPPV